MSEHREAPKVICPNGNERRRWASRAQPYLDIAKIVALLSFGHFALQLVVSLGTVVYETRLQTKILQDIHVHIHEFKGTK